MHAPPIAFGSAWYPEHWPESRWPRDLELMRQAHMNVVRMAEFAWSRLEPRDGEFDLDWLERAVALAAEAGLVSVLCTPSAAPPAWLTRKHPEILRVVRAATGEVQLHGHRRQYDPASAVYRRYVARITEVMARRFDKDPRIIGWQIDNEFSHDAQNPATLSAFRTWLKARYGSLDALNAAWSGHYWSLAYTDWEEIPPPDRGGAHPGHLLAWRRFCSWLYADFQREQIDILRAHLRPGQWITHNLHPNDDYERSAIVADIDVVSFDHYILPDRNSYDPGSQGVDSDRFRCLKQKPFWIMETMPGFTNWRSVNYHLEPGGTRCFGWHMVAHGAEAVLYWQWRSAPNNQEQLHGAVLAQDGEPRPVFEEIARLGHDLETHADLIDQSRVAPHLALIDAWHDRLLLGAQAFHHEYNAKFETERFYRAWQHFGCTLDVNERVDNLADLPVVVAPHLHLLTAADTARLRAYVEGGGHLILGPRSGVKGVDGEFLESLPPGPLADLLGAVVEEFYALRHALPVQGLGVQGQASIFAERLRVVADDVEVLATFGAGDRWLEGRPAIATRAAGQGRVTWVGGCLDEALHAALAHWAAQVSGIHPEIHPSPGVEIVRRRGADGTLHWVILNGTDAAQHQPLPGLFHDALGDRDNDSLTLEPFGVAWVWKM